MAVDPTYPSVVQRRQDGSMYVPTSRSLNIEDGGYTTVPVTVMATTSGTITNFGLTTIGTTIAASYTLAVPTAAGMEKTIAVTVHGATTVTQVVSSGAANFLCGGTTAATSIMTFTSRIQSVTLLSASTALWVVKANNGVVAFT